jgi:hypothetical protein
MICSVTWANSSDHLQGTVVGDYAVGYSETSAVATKSLYMLVICTFSIILRKNFNISWRYSGHLACSRSEIIEAAFHSRFHVFQLLFGEVGKFSLSRSRKANCLYSGEATRIRSPSSPSSTEFVKKIFSNLDSIMSSCITLLLDGIPVALQPDIRGCGTTHVWSTFK